ncbi:NAD-dependent epimerase/dehydratase family protein [Paractinoplanes atraurantiacus]|uniref:Nucleoside-diphosphate-sugar epimerase n=1 Tax=Paractinoplanes atraurantiacus TaxID=1036182 RepID=A0A285J8R5_9ACTN|nr:NAD-dependent epimerase/dehydratase family protein [Actinoplanes atraurantiacus]SNY56247.1 Nucleoside-diphosphate-sugar epimerase [Actinoplanes atraurantiacus]
MDVFLTGGSGYLGGVVLERLIEAGHRVEALARSERAAERVAELGAEPVRGDLSETGVLGKAADRAAAVIHTAVDYVDPNMADIEAVALNAMLAGRPFIYTSTGLVYGEGQRSEDDPVGVSTAAQPHKVLGERTVLAAGGTVLRVPLIHGRGGSALIQGLMGFGRTRETVPFIGDGKQMWSAVHVDDLADLFVLALEKPQPGRIFNAASGDTFEMGQLVRLIAERTGAAAVSLSPEQARGQLGVLARSGGMDATRARETFGWAPSRSSLLDDVRGESY